MKLFDKLFHRKPREPVYWQIGGPSSWINFDQRKIVGFSNTKPIKGDWLFSPMRSGKTAIFEFVKVKPTGDPHDMFFATVKDIGYTDEIVYDTKSSNIFNRLCPVIRPSPSLPEREG